MPFARRLLKRALRRPPDEALSTIELIGIVVVTGILATLAVFGIGSLIDDAESNVAESNLNTVVSAIQSIGSDRLDTGGFSYTGGSAGTAAEMITSLRERVSNINFAAMPDGTGGTAGGLWADGMDGTAAGTDALPDADPNTVYVAVNSSGYANGNSLAISQGHIARVVVRSAEETTMCAILVRSTDSAGVGYDSWTVKTGTTANGKAFWRAWCLPARQADAAVTADSVTAPNTVVGGPPLGGVVNATNVAYTSAPAFVAAAAEAADAPTTAQQERIFMNNFFATLPDPGRDDIEG